MRQWLIWILIVAGFGCGRQGESGSTASRPSSAEERETFLLFVKIPDPVPPIQRGKKYEDPLHEFLVSHGLGRVTGGGTQLSETNAAGQRSIEWVGVDVDVYDPEEAVPLVVKKLKAIGVPDGTEIEQYKPTPRTIRVD